MLTLRQLSDRPLDDVLRYIDDGGAHAQALGELTLRELSRGFSECGQRSRWAQAADVHGEAFDALVLEVLREAGTRTVQAAYLREQLGGPRWKLRGSLARLEAQDLVLRTGRTSDTTYCAVL